MYLIATTKKITINISEHKYPFYPGKRKTKYNYVNLIGKIANQRFYDNLLKIINEQNLCGRMWCICQKGPEDI